MSITRSLTRAITQSLTRTLTTPGAGGGAVEVLATMGTVNDPANMSSAINSSTTWIQPQSLPVDSVLREFTCYASTSGTVKIKVLQPVKGGGFNVISDQTVTVPTTGLVTLSVDAGTMTEVPVPAHSLLAVNTPGAVIRFTNDGIIPSGMGYLYAGGDVSGNGVTTDGVAYWGEVQMQFTTLYERGAASPGAYWVDDDFAGTILPPKAVHSGWTFSVAGQATSAGTGLGNYCDFYHTTNVDRCTWAVEFLFTGASDRFAVYRKPVLNEPSVDAGTVVEADIANNQLVIYQTWGGGALPASHSTLTLTNLTLATGVRYRMELIKSSRQISVRIIDTTNNAEQTLAVDNSASTLTGLAFGRPGFANLAGSATVKQAQFYPAVTNPSVLIYGDSITEGSATTDALSYAQLVLDALATPGNGWSSGDGGTATRNALRRLRHDLSYSLPRYVVMYAGANNANSDVERDKFDADITEAYTLIQNAGAVPVICTLTPNSDATRNARIAAMNATLLTKGWRLARFDIALSVGGDGTTYDATKMADGVHPNAAGHAALAARLQADWPELFA